MGIVVHACCVAAACGEAGTERTPARNGNAKKPGGTHVPRSPLAGGV